MWKLVEAAVHGFEGITTGMLESMVRNVSTGSLQSLVVVGYCTLLRVGSEWQMKYPISVHVWQGNN